MISTLFLKAQSRTNLSNSVSIEVLGLGRYGSAGYQRLIVGDSSMQYYFRTGIGVMRFINFENKFNPDIAIPTMFEAVFGEKKHHYEISGGQVYTSYSRFSTELGTEKRDHEFNLAIGAAYRYGAGKNWVYRIAVYGILDDFEVLRPWGGLSARFRFGK